MKIIKKVFRIIIPNNLKEKAKENYFNIIKKEKFFRINNFYKTVFINKVEVITKTPLYYILNDIKRYEKYFKVKKDNIVIDAGANDGSLSLYYSKIVKKNGHVFSFEPDSLNLDLIKQNFNINVFDDNITILTELLWNENTIIDFFESGGVASSVHYKSKNSIVVKKKAITLDNFYKLNKLNKVDFVKMDIEGAEIEALAGCKQMIKELSPNFAIATYHIVKGKQTYIEVEEFFKKQKYPFKTVFYNDGEIITYAGKNL
jgi:FkbM family methyltransferase